MFSFHVCLRFKRLNWTRPSPLEGLSSSMKIHGKWEINSSVEKSEKESPSHLFSKCKLFILFGFKVIREFKDKEKISQNSLAGVEAVSFINLGFFYCRIESLFKCRCSHNIEIIFSRFLDSVKGDLKSKWLI